MKNLLKLLVVLTSFIGTGLVAMNTGGIRATGAGVGAHARALQQSRKEYVELSRNRNRTEAETARLKQLDAERAAHRTSIRQGGIRNINRAL